MRLIILTERFNPSDHPKNVQQVNAFLHANGVPKEINLRRGNGYYYFYGEDDSPYNLSMWPRDSVYIYAVGGYTFQQWLEEYNQLKDDAREAGQYEMESTALKEQGDAEHWKTLAQTGFWGKQGAGALFLARDTGRLLIAHRSRSVEQPGTWGTWGGAVDDTEGETPRKAVEREVEEESGYRGRFELVPLYVFKKGTFQYHNFLVIVDREFTPKLDWENQGYRWVAYGDWPSPLHFGLEALIKNSGEEIQQQIGLRESIDLTHETKRKDSVSSWVRKLRGKSLYFRHQPKGKKLIGWTSEGSEARLPKGYIFAYRIDAPYEMLPWKAYIDLDREEIVVFAGKGEYDPGDHEGVAVKPTKEVARLSLATFKDVAKVLDPSNSKAYNELVRVEEIWQINTR